VHSGRPLLVRGYGSARLGVEEDSAVVDRPVPVTENTKFAIASLSKAFTATLVGILLKEQEAKSVFSRAVFLLLCRLLRTVRTRAPNCKPFATHFQTKNFCFKFGICDC